MAKAPNQVGGLLEKIDKYPDHLRLIGLIVTEFARAESSLCLTLWELMGDPIRANAVFWTLGNSKARCDVVRAMANEVLKAPEHAKLLAGILAMVEDLRGAASKRNDLAHGEWGTPSKGGADPFISIQRPATKSPVFQRIWTIAQLQELADQISAIEAYIQTMNRVIVYRLDPKQRQHFDDMRRQFPGFDAFFQKYE